MQFVFQPLRNASFDPLSPRDAGVLLANARTLQHFAATGRSQSLLLGKNFGLLCESEQAEGAECFRRAATDLGAHVAHIRPALSDLSEDAVLMDTGRVLGRLYDAIECLGLAPAFVKRLEDATNVPVYDGIASAQHPTAKLAEQLGGPGSSDDSRRYMVQAVLVSTLG